MEAVVQGVTKWKSGKMPQFGNFLVSIKTSFRSSTMSAPTLVINPYYVVVMNEYNKQIHVERDNELQWADSFLCSCNE